MKSPSMKIALLAAVILTSPIASFAGGQPAKYYTPPKGEVQRPAGRAWDRRALGVKFVVDHPKTARTNSADRAAVSAFTPAPTPRPQ